MRSIQGVIVTAVAAAVLSPAAVTTTAASALLARQTAHAAAGCRVAGTIRVGRDPRGLAVNPVTDTVSVANVQSGTVSRISGRAGTVTATIAAGATPFWVGRPEDPEDRRDQQRPGRAGDGDQRAD